MTFGMLTRGLITGPPTEVLLGNLVPSSIIVTMPLTETAWVVLTRDAEGGETVDLSSDDPSVATVPASVVFSEGDVLKSFQVTGASTGSTVIRASYDGIEKTADVQVTYISDSYHADVMGNAANLRPDPISAGEE